MPCVHAHARTNVNTIYVPRARTHARTHKHTHIHTHEYVQCAAVYAHRTHYMRKSMPTHAAELYIIKHTHAHKQSHTHT